MKNTLKLGDIIEIYESEPKDKKYLGIFRVIRRFIGPTHKNKRERFLCYHLNNIESDFSFEFHTKECQICKQLKFRKLSNEEAAIYYL